MAARKDLKLGFFWPAFSMSVWAFVKLPCCCLLSFSLSLSLILSACVKVYAVCGAPSMLCPNCEANTSLFSTCKHGRPVLVSLRWTVDM